MAYAGNESDEYVPDSDDSNQEDERPNRWTGPPSTWQQLNSAEIDALTALNEIRNQDLSIHLYNAFALKHRHGKGAIQDGAKPVPNQDVDAATGQPVQEDKWAPPKLWTAWPLPANLVPRPEFMKRADAADGPLRMHVPYTPRSELEETVSATMLRLAKEKFRARQAAQQLADAAESGPESGNEEGAMASRSKARSRTGAGLKPRVMKSRSTSEGEMMDVDDPQVEKRPSSIPPKLIPLKTVVATDDELSYSLLRPSAQGILAKLDTTLAILHKAQESRINCASESDTSDASSRSQSQSRSRSRGPAPGPSRDPTRSPDAGRGRGRGRPPNSRASSATPAPRDSVPPASGRRGRPRKVYPRLEGETEREYAVRIARLRKKPIPRFLAGDGGDDASESTPAPNSAAEYTDGDANANANASAGAKPPRTPRRRRDSTGGGAWSDATLASGSRPPRAPRMSRVRLRDWRDVLGAAALAGFPAAALDRAARRCADLFGQGFTLHTLREGGGTAAGRPDDLVRYEPGMAAPGILPDGSGDDGNNDDDDDDDDDEGSAALRWRRAASATPSEAGEAGGRVRGRSRSTAPRSSRSRSASGGRTGAARHFCVFANCPRAADAFARRTNLVRHLRLVHKCEGADALLEVDSEDEMHGAVHVDGFLRPIRVRPGWREEENDRDNGNGGGGKGGGAEKRKRQRQRQPRKRAREADARMRDVDSTTGHETSD